MRAIDPVIVVGPYPAESSATTSPPAVVAAIAALNERHGKSCVQGLASLPELATNVRCAAKSGIANAKTTTETALRARVIDPPRHHCFVIVVSDPVTLLIEFEAMTLSPAELIEPA